MQHLGIPVTVKNQPPLDPDFLPLNRFNEAFLQTAKQPFGVALERSGGQMAVHRTFIHGSADRFQADVYYVERLVKTLLWAKGGFRVYLAGDKAVCDAIAAIYADGGKRDFDFHFMAHVYEHPFEVVRVDTLPQAADSPQRIGGHLDGCRIGFDAGGSDRKVSAVIDGKSVYSEEVVWYPKITADPDYHYEGIVAALKSAAEHLPRVDAVGVSSAGIYIGNRTMRASLFLQVPDDLFERKVKDIYIRAITDTFGPIPYAVINDGDVSALAGTMSLGENNVLGIAMGTSEAAGFVDENGCITGWLNELAFVPMDAHPRAAEDEWSGDIGCGVKYLSQDGVIKLAPAAGIDLDGSLSPAQKLAAVQALMEADDPRAGQVYDSIGVYLAHALAGYYELYRFRHVLLLGRVMSGKGGERILARCKEVLADEYPAVNEAIRPALPDEKFRRVGQSAAAASLPEIK